MDGVSMMSGMGETTTRKCFRTFCKFVVRDLFRIHVRLPKGDDLKEVMQEYHKRGLTGAMGSIDVTHILWDRVPAHLACDFVGKEGKPTLAFEVIVDFTRRVLAVTHGFPGSENDKTISRNDTALEMIRTEGPYATQQFQLYDAGGAKHQWQEAYLICDNGYVKVGRQSECTRVAPH